MAYDRVRIDNTAAWLRRATQDLRRVERCLAHEPPDLEDAVFHCQQSSEKALKAFLTWHDEPFRKTHDLAALGKQCVGIDPTLEKFIDPLDDLTEYARLYRYPTKLLEPSLEDANEAATLAREIVAQVRRRLPSEVGRAAGE